MNKDWTPPEASPSATRYLTRPEGRVEYDVAGQAPLVVLVPGMGDLRAGYRFLAPALRDAGHYPQSQRPDLTAGAVLRFLATVHSHACGPRPDPAQHPARRRLAHAAGQAPALATA
jgi:hypothetical protein